MTTQPNMYVRIAAAVIAEAAGIDTRIRKGLANQEALDRQIESWARVFQGQPIWPREALEAVAEHYRNGDAFPIMPGNILEYCKRQPVWSSPEHAAAWLDWAAENPWTPALEMYVGRPVPGMQPDSYDLADKARLVERNRAFVAEHRQALVEAILGTRAAPLALES